MRILGTGKTKSGKSYYTFYHLYKTSKCPVKIYIDPKPSKYIVPTTRNGKVINSIDQLSQSTLLFPAYKEPLPHEIILKPNFNYNFELEAARLFTYIIQEKQKGNEIEMLLVVDEAHRFGNKHKIQDILGKILKEGEAHNINTILLTQHAVEISDIAILNCEYFFIFGINPVMLEYAEKKLHMDTEEKDLSWLKIPYHGILYDYDSKKYIDDKGMIYESI